MTPAPINRCVECFHTITNPLCTSCLAERMNMVIGETYPGLAKEIIPANIEGETECISCHKKTGLCAHCFSKDIYEYLKERNPAAAKEFCNRFDFEIIKMRKSVLPRRFS
ncbi:MAG: hypothetical protein Q8Q01_03660 [archaeon]|nr:hypothetical protein [archaeon]